MKTFKSALYGSIQEPENFEELIEIITFQKADKQSVYMWRGQTNIDWRLDHSAYRRLLIDQKNITEEDLIFYEKSLLKQATHKGYRLQGGRILTDFELLANLQHHGAATRLLDFTRSAMIALWFCINKNPKQTGLLIGLHVNYLGGYEGEDQYAEYEAHIKNINQYPHCQTWEPPIVTPRIAAQHSQFIYSGLSKDKRSSIKLADDSDANLFVAISPKIKIELDSILEQTFDIRYQTLFPDIHGFSNANGPGVSSHRMWRW